MSYSIISPPNSFVDFNPPVVINCLEQPDISLPAYNDFGIQFQFQVAGDLSTDTQLKAIIANADGDKILDQNIFAQNICYQYRLSASPSQFPITVNEGQSIPAGQYDYPSFLTALSTFLGFAIPSAVFDYCCLFPSISIATTNGNITFGSFWDFGFVIYPATSMNGLLMINDCFRYGIADASGNILAVSNKFRRVNDTCFSTLLAYWNDDDAFGFTYPVPAFYNTVRLPFSFRKPIYPVTEQVYTKSDGTIKRASSRVNKEYEGYTDVLTEYYHERLIVALKHDHVQFTNSDIGLQAKELFVQGDYKPDWIDDNTVVVASAKFKISVPISNINSNCYSQNSVPCCPPFIVSNSATDTSFTINVDFGGFVSNWNLQWRTPGTAAWNTITGITSKSYTIQNMQAGVTIIYELQNVCGSTIGPWSGDYTGKTTGDSTCDSTVTGIVITQDSLTTAKLSFTPNGSATQWLVQVDGQMPPLFLNTPSAELTGLALGNHALSIRPVCTDGVQGSEADQSFTIAGTPSLTLVSDGDTGPGGVRNQAFLVGASVNPGNRFYLEVYLHPVVVVAGVGDTSTSIAQKLAAAVNAVTAVQWNSHQSAPPTNTPGFPPSATAVGSKVIITLNYQNEFLGNATVS